jgi:hypothetical protein
MTTIDKTLKKSASCKNGKAAISLLPIAALSIKEKIIVP